MVEITLGVLLIGSPRSRIGATRVAAIRRVAVKEPSRIAGVQQDDRFPEGKPGPLLLQGLHGTFGVVTIQNGALGFLGG